MSRISLNPTANPVDTFAAPEIRQDTDGSDLLQLASSLQQLEPGLAQLTSIYNAKERDEQLSEAIKLQQEKQFKNLEEINAAVQRGELDENENPWKLLAVRQLVAKQSFRSHAARVEAELSADPTYRTSDDFEGLQQELLTRLTEPYADADAATLRALTPDIERFASGYLNKHGTRRSAERELEAADAFSTQLRSNFTGSPEALQALAGDTTPEIQAAASGVITQTQATIDAMVRVAHPTKVRDYALAAIEDAAVRSGRVEVADRLLSELSVGGKSLSTDLDPAYRSDLEAKIVKSQLDTSRRLQAAQNLQDTQAYEQGIAAIEAEWATGAYSNPSQIKIDLTQMGSESRQKVLDFRETLAKRSAESRFTHASSELLAGRFSESDEATFRESMFALGFPGLDGVQKFERVSEILDTAEWGETGARSLIELEAMSIDSTVSKQAKLTKLTSLADTGSISKADFEKYLDRAFSADTASGNLRSSMVRASLEKYRALAVAGVSASPESVTYDNRLTAAAQARVDYEAAELSKELHAFIDANPGATGDEVDKFFDSRVDYRSGQAGGYTSSKFLEEQALIKVRREIGSQEVVRDFAGSLTFSDGRFTVHADDKSGSLARTPRLFEDRDDLSFNLGRVVSGLGIDGSANQSLSTTISVLETQLDTLDVSSKNDRRLKTALEELIARMKAARVSVTQPEEPPRPLPDTEAEGG